MITSSADAANGADKTTVATAASKILRIVCSSSCLFPLRGTPATMQHHPFSFLLAASEYIRCYPCEGIDFGFRLNIAASKNKGAAEAAPRDPLAKRKCR